METPTNPSRFDVAIDEDGGTYPDIVEIDQTPWKTFIKTWLLPVVVGVVVVVLVCGALVFWGQGGEGDNSFDNTVLIVSLDGFRDRFLDEKNPALFPNMAQMRAEGVNAEYLKAVFPTLTFPNHYAIITGLFPTNDGIVHNTMYDPGTEEIFTMRTEDPYWWGGEPLWITNQKQNQKSGTMFWPGSDVKIDGMYPTYYRPFDSNVPFHDRVDQIIEWLDLPYRERPTLLTLYFEEPDHTCHEYGPSNSSEVDPQILRVDEALGYLFERMKAIDVYEKVDVIVLSDHGMTDTPLNQVVRMQDYDLNFGSIFQIDNTSYDTTGLDGWCVACGAVATFIPFEGKEQEIYDKMLKIPGIQAYTNISIEEERPDWNYYNNTRIPAIIAVGDLGYSINTQDCVVEILGNHGYDNDERDMQAIFLARGPHFKTGGVVTPPLDNLDIYNMASSILKLDPAKSDGSLTMEEIKELYFN